MADKRVRDQQRRVRYQRALWWLERGVAIVPLKPRSKQIQPGYGARRAQITDTDSAHQWFLKTDANLGVVLGGTSGLIVADWDDVYDYEAWRASTGTLMDTLAEQTARGYHLFFFGEGLSSAVADGCEFKAQGVCTVSPSTHPSGLAYRIVRDAPIVHLDHETACALFPFLSKALQKRAEREYRHASGSGESGSQGMQEGEGVVARIKATCSTVAEMETAGIILRPAGADTLVGLCPFHDDHHPSLWVYVDSGLWGCNKPACPAAGIHDVIDFRAFVRGISNSAAIRQLAHEFL